MKTLAALFSGLSSLNLFSVTKEGKKFLATILQSFHLVRLRPDLDEFPSRCFHGAEIYFRTSNGDLYRIYEIDKGFFVMNVKGYKSVDIMDDSAMYYSFVALGQKFRYGDNITQGVIEIVLVTDIEVSAELIDEDLLTLRESKLVEQFYS